MCFILRSFLMQSTLYYRFTLDRSCMANITNLNKPKGKLFFNLHLRSQLSVKNHFQTHSSNSKTKRVPVRDFAIFVFSSVLEGKLLPLFKELLPNTIWRKSLDTSKRWAFQTKHLHISYNSILMRFLTWLPLLQELIFLSWLSNIFVI